MSPARNPGMIRIGGRDYDRCKPCLQPIDMWKIKIDGGYNGDKHKEDFEKWVKSEEYSDGTRCKHCKQLIITDRDFNNFFNIANEKWDYMSKSDMLGQHEGKIDGFKNLKELHNIHKDEDIWVLASGPSLNFMDKSFFENKITLGINQIYKYFPCDYVVCKDFGEKERYEEIWKELARSTETKLLIPEYNAGQIAGSKNKNCRFLNPYENFYMFEHNNNGYGATRYPDGTIKLSQIHKKSHLITCFKSTLATAMHLAAYLGAKNIIIVGGDNGEIDGELYLKDYVQSHWKSGGNSRGISGWLGGVGDIHEVVKEKLQYAYGCNVHSLNPFINFNLEGHDYTPCISKKSVKIRKR